MRRKFLFVTLMASWLAVAGHAQSYRYIYGTTSAVTSLLQADNGEFYGIDYDGFFSLSPGGTYTVLIPDQTGTLCLELPDGTFFGAVGGTGAKAPAIMKFSSTGAVSTFATLPQTNIPVPPPCPAMASDGNYYGGVSWGGTYNSGFLYQLTPAGNLHVFYNFTGTLADGYGPTHSLLQGSDGDLYGSDGNDMFRYNPSSGLSILTSTTQFGQALIEGPDNNFYALTADSGNDTISKVTPSGAVSQLYYPTGGESPQALYLGANGLSLVSNEAAASSCGPEMSGPSNAIEIYQVSYAGYPDENPILIYDDYGTVSGQFILGGDGAFYGGLTDEGYGYLDGEGCVANGILYSVVAVPVPTNTPAIQISLNPPHVLPGGSATLAWQVNNAFSKTMQQCYAYGGWTGKQALSGSIQVTPPIHGDNPYSLVCGGVEAASGSVTASNDFSLTLNASATTIVAGMPVTLTAQVQGAAVPGPTGAIKFMYGSRLLGSAALNGSGAAMFAASSTGIPPGTYQITANYTGDANYGSAISPAQPIIVVNKSATTLALATTTPTLTGGQPASFTLTATGTINPPTGTVSFHYGSMNLGSATLHAAGGTMSTAAFSASSSGVPPGSYSVTASYAGDGWNLPATSNPVTVKVVADTVSVTASPNPVPAGDGFTLTASVSGKSTPTGTVVFYAGTQALGSNSLDGSGVASVSLPAGTLVAGSYAVTAYYAGDAHNPADTSAAVTLVVQ